MADIAELGVGVDTSGLKSGQRELLNFQKAAIRAAGGVDDLNKVQSKLFRNDRGQFVSQAEAIKRYEAEIVSLASKYGVLESASESYNSAQMKLTTSLSASAAATERTDANLERLTTQLHAVANEADTAANGVRMVGTAARTGGDAMEVSGHHAANLSFQLNDIGMMMASGQSPFMLMIQQGPQVAQVFSQMSAQGQRLGPTLASAFRMVLNPTTLLTLAVIGGTAALVQWGRSALGAADNAKTTEDRLSELRTAYDSLNTAADRNRMSLWDQIDTYGQYWQSIRLVNEQLLEQSTLEAERAAKGAIGALGIDPRAIEGMENQIRSFMERRDDFSEQSRQIAIEAQGFNQESLDQYGLQYDQLVRLSEIQKELERNDLGLNERNRLSAEFNTLVKIGTDNGAALATEMEDAGKFVNYLAEIMTRAQAATERADKAMKGFSQTASSTSLMHLVSQAAALGARLREAASVRLPGSGSFGSSILEGAANAWNMALDRVEDVRNKGLGDRPLRRPFELGVTDPEDTGTGGGVGGGGGSSVDRIQEDFQNRWQALQEGFKGEFDLSLTEYQKQLETLDWALSQKLIKEQEFQRNKQLLYTMTFGTEYEQQQLQYQLELDALTLARENELIAEADFIRRRNELYSGAVSEMGTSTNNLYALQLGQLAGHLGEMSQLAGGGYDKLLKAQRVFAAASALISTYQGAAKALELPFPYNLFAAGKVIAAGVGFVSAIKSATSSGASTGGGGGSAQDAVQNQAAQQEPNREVLVRLEGDEWLVGMADNILNQIYEQTKDGRVVVARDF